MQPILRSRCNRLIFGDGLLTSTGLSSYQGNHLLTTQFDQVKTIANSAKSFSLPSQSLIYVSWVRIHSLITLSWFVMPCHFQCQRCMRLQERSVLKTYVAWYVSLRSTQLRPGTMASSGNGAQEACPLASSNCHLTKV